ncbi:MAG: hypothetical protein ACR2FY_11615 [Pirellulaceae bacterium]
MRCEEGYHCDVCGQDVENIWESDLYLRYVIGLIDPETLHTTKERHIGCNPALAQFIVDPEFDPVGATGDFRKEQLDPQFVQERETLITRGWRRLKELSTLEGLSLLEYPLEEVRERMKREA